ncbi:uncharacterized protein LOC144318122 isoform X1 [Canis aureus]
MPPKQPILATPPSALENLKLAPSSGLCICWNLLPLDLCRATFFSSVRLLWMLCLQRSPRSKVVSKPRDIITILYLTKQKKNRGKSREKPPTANLLCQGSSGEILHLQTRGALPKVTQPVEDGLHKDRCLLTPRQVLLPLQQAVQKSRLNQKVSRQMGKSSQQEAVMAELELHWSRHPAGPQ